MKKKFGVLGEKSYLCNLKSKRELFDTLKKADVTQLVE